VRDGASLAAFANISPGVHGNRVYETKSLQRRKRFQCSEHLVDRRRAPMETISKVRSVRTGSEGILGSPKLNSNANESVRRVGATIARMRWTASCIRLS